MRMTPNTPDPDSSTWGHEIATAIVQVIFTMNHPEITPAAATQAVANLAELIDELVSELDRDIDGKLDAP